MRPPREVLDYYDSYPEEIRLQQGPFRLEFERTQEILSRVLPPPPAEIVDVGGAAGAYSFWLAGAGYSVHLVDGSERLVGEAKRHRDRPVLPHRVPPSPRRARRRNAPGGTGCRERAGRGGPWLDAAGL